VRGRGELVLLVDDEPVLRELGREILESHGYRVRAVASGEDALSFVRESGESVSLVILDLVMPGLDGGETYRRLRDVNRRVPVLLSSGLSSEDAVEEILADGATGFIPKPYGIGELTQAVSLALRRDAHVMH
jgi:CheY-like chemotaxis protein